MKSDLRLLYEEWSDCGKCHLSEARRKARRGVGIVRGEVPCDVLFVGDSPAISENVRDGVPLSGPVGQVQDEIIAEAVPDGVTWCIANLLGCKPSGDCGKTYERSRDVRTVGKPDDAAVRACSPRLQSIVRLCEPKLIVCLGDDAEHYLMTESPARIELDRGIPMISCYHPSAIARAKTGPKEFMWRKTVAQLRQAVETHVLIPV